MHGDDRLLPVERERDFVPHVPGFDRARREEHEEERTVVQRAGDFVRPVGARVDAFVVPETAARAIEEVQVAEDRVVIAMGVADECVRLLSAVGLERHTPGVDAHRSEIARFTIALPTCSGATSRTTVS